MRKLCAAVLATIIVCLSGCATRYEMSPTTQTKSIDTSVQSYALITLTLKNVYRSFYQPSPIVVYVERGAAAEKADRLNFPFDWEGSARAASEQNFFVRLPLQPGKYVLRGLLGQSGIFPFHGIFFTPLHYDIDIKPHSVVYLGHIDATVVERKDGELRAGPLLPLLDQAATGFSSGTWDIKVSDDADHDFAQLREKFPALQGVTIDKDVLPVWDKKKATEWWAAH